MNAMRRRLDKCKALTLENPSYSHDGADLKTFRSFRWMLSDADEADLEVWEKAALENSKQTLEQKMAALTDKGVDGAKDDKANAIVSVSTPAPPLKKVRKDKGSSSKDAMPTSEGKADLEDGELPETACNGQLLSFFGSRAV